MKFFSLIGVALAKECYEAVLPTGARAERGEVSAGELNVAIEEFAACAERDANVDVTPFYEAQTKGTDKSSNSKISIKNIHIKLEIIHFQLTKYSLST